MDLCRRVIRQNVTKERDSLRSKLATVRQECDDVRAQAQLRAEEVESAKERMQETTTQLQEAITKIELLRVRSCNFASWKRIC